jgi:hypothetical protein
MIEPAPGKRPVSRLEWTHGCAAAASTRADEARKLRDYGPTRITWADVEKAASRRVQPPKKLSREAAQEFVEAVQREAGASTCPETRRRLNQLLVRHGFPKVPRHVGQTTKEDWHDLEPQATAA